MSLDKKQDLIGKFLNPAKDIKNDTKSIADDLKIIDKKLSKLVQKFSKNTEDDAEKDFDAKFDWLFDKLEYKDDEFRKLGYEMKNFKKAISELASKIKYF